MENKTQNQSLEGRMTDMNKLNILTEYPAIPMYHLFGEKENLPKQSVEFPLSEELVLTEKIEGVHARIILTDKYTLIGSRNKLLWAMGDLLCNSDQQIVATLEPLVSKVREHMPLIDHDNAAHIVYGEICGRGADSTSRHFRIFDIAKIWGIEHKISIMSFAELALQRGNGVVHWANEAQLQSISDCIDISLAPRFKPWAPLPSSIEGTACLLSQVRALTTSPTPPEELIFRTASRSVIAKARFEDYQKSS